jgi:hypothetical protein
MHEDHPFGRATSGTRGDAAFPQIRKVRLVEVGTHDAGFSSYRLWRILIGREAEGMVRLSSTMKLPVLLGEWFSRSMHCRWAIT